jgi:hypothetical protein
MRDPATVSEMSLRSCGVLDQVMMLLEQTKNNYPSQEFPEETFKVWAPFWLGFAEKDGLDHLKTALKTHIVSSNFYPTPADLATLLNQQRSDKNEKSAIVPSNRAQIARLVGPKIAAQCSVCTVKDAERWYGRDSAQKYAEKLATETLTLCHVRGQLF